MAEMTFTAHAVSETSSRTRVKAPPFEMLVDKPASLGGTDEGPNPMAYLMAAVAGCFASTARHVAEEMGMTLRSLAVDVSATLDPAGMTGKDPSVRSGLSKLTMRLRVDTDADDATVADWIARSRKRCPVEDTITHGTAVEVVRRGI